MQRLSTHILCPLSQVSKVLVDHMDHLRVCFSSVTLCCFLYRLSSFCIVTSLLEYTLNIENYKVFIFYICHIYKFLFFVLEKYNGEMRNHLFQSDISSCIIPVLGKGLPIYLFSAFSQHFIQPSQMNFFHYQLCPLSLPL